MTDTTITDPSEASTAAQPDAETAQVPQLDREMLFQRSLNARDRLRRMYDTARKKLERARRAEDYLAYLISRERTLIGNLLGLWFSAEDIADVLIEEMVDIPVARKKIVAAIRKCQQQPDTDAATLDGNVPKKRRGRPPKNAAATDGIADNPAQDTVPPSKPLFQQVGSASAEKAPASSAANSITATGNSVEMSRNFSGNSKQSPEKTSAKDTKNRTQTQPAAAAPAATPVAMPGLKEDTEERKQRLRKKAPTWVNGYSDHPKYGSIVARLDGEGDADYFWRMHHTAPPWADEQPRFPDDTQTQWIAKCWLLTSPEERAAHQASLPTTAR